jgi:hypothetical protein
MTDRYQFAKDNVQQQIVGVKQAIEDIALKRDMGMDTSADENRLTQLRMQTAKMVKAMTDRGYTFDLMGLTL